MARLRRSPADPLATALRAAATLMKGHDAAHAACGVIGVRTGMAAEALFAPTAANNAEMSLMVTEKTAAFARAGAAMAKGAARASRDASRFVTDEAAHAGKALSRLAACRNPGELLAMQGRLAWDMWARGLAHGISAGATATRTGQAALHPVHRTVTANARRLKSR